MRAIAPFLMIVTFLFTGCIGTDGPSPQQTASGAMESLPTWVVSKPADTPQTFYGVGIGSTLEDASTKARAAIASRIQVTVESGNVCEELYARHNDSEALVQKCRTETRASARETLQGTEVAKTRRVDGQWYALVTADRPSLFKQQKSRFDSRDRAVDREWKAFADASPFEKLKLADAMEQKILEAEQAMPLLGAYSEDFDGRKQRKDFSAKRDAVRKAYDQLTVSLTYDAASKPLAGIIRDALSQENITLVNRNGGARVSLKTDTSNRRTCKSTQHPVLYCVVRKTVIAVRDAKGRVVSENEIVSRVSSPRSYDEALRNTRQFSQTIGEQGILSFLMGSAE